MKQSHLDDLKQFITEAGENTCSFWQFILDSIQFTGDLAAAVWSAIRNPRKIRFRETFYYLNLCGPDALQISLLICLLMGLIMGYQSGVQMHRYGADNFLPALVGCIIVRELGPLMIAVIAAGRAGSSFTAEIAAMKSTDEINAMLTMGLSPWRFLVIPKLIAMMLMLPALTLLGDIAGIAGGMIVGVGELDLPSSMYYSVTILWAKPKFILEGLLKSEVFAVIITAVACMRGFRAEPDSLGVGKATTLSVVTSLIAIIIADFLLAYVFNIIYYGN